jgi:GTP-binding protein HflX
VGFIRNLPHALVTSFRATLEEVQQAALVLHVSDAGSPDTAAQDAQVEQVLRELDCQAKPRLHVYNKVDLLPPDKRDALVDDERTVHVSALRGTGLEALLERIDRVIEVDPVRRVRLAVPQSEGKTLALLEGHARVHSREYREGLVDFDVDVSESVLRQVHQFLVE